jgi:hypothetical protein
MELFHHCHKESIAHPTSLSGSQQALTHAAPTRSAREGTYMLNASVYCPAVVADVVYDV